MCLIWKDTLLHRERAEGASLPIRSRKRERATRRQTPLTYGGVAAQMDEWKVIIRI